MSSVILLVRIMTQPNRSKWTKPNWWEYLFFDKPKQNDTKRI